jgi:ABC-type multidrug transport system fused ATPase/permease subunit
MIVGTITVASIVIPHILILLPFLVSGLLYYRRLYQKSTSQMNKLETSTKAPILSYLSNSMEGLGVIRSFEAKKVFVNEFVRLQNQNTKVWVSFSTAGRWLSIRYFQCNLD